MGNTITATGGSSQFVNNFRKSSARNERALERLSTGKRINRPSDDPSGFVTAESLRSELVRLQAEFKTLTGKQHSVRKQQSGLAALQEQLIELRGLMTSVGGNLLSDAQRQLYDHQIAESLESIGRLRREGQPVGLNAVDGVDATLPQMTSLLEERGPAQAEKAAALVANAADEVVFSRAALATYERYQIETFKQLTQDLIVTHTQALSQVEDADFAEEASEFAASQASSQGAMAALAYSGKTHTEQVELLLDAVSEAARRNVVDALV